MQYKVINVKGEGRIGLKPVAFHTAQAQSQNSNQLSHEIVLVILLVLHLQHSFVSFYPKCMTFSEVKMLYNFM